MAGYADLLRDDEQNDRELARVAKPKHEPRRGALATARSALEGGAFAAKGAAQGWAGLPGDIEGLARTLRLLPPGETVIPTSDDVRKWIDERVSLLPADASERHKEAARGAEKGGELLAPGGYIKLLRGGKAVAQRAANMSPSPASGGLRAQAGAFNPDAPKTPEPEPMGPPREPMGPPRPAPVPRSIERMGASKEAREASLARRTAEAAEQDAPVTATPRTAGERAAVAPDKYRQLYQQEGEAAVLRAVIKGEHIRRDPSGGYIGFPRHITNRRGIADMRKSLDRQISDAQEALDYAEVPERRGNWYPRAREGIRETTEPKLMDRTIDAHSVFSAGVSPESETAFALRHLQSRGLGAPQRGYRDATQRVLDEADAEGRRPNLAFKVGEYGKKNDYRITDRPPFGVNDFRSAQSHGYTDIRGEPWSAGVNDTMHPVMDAESMLTVKRARDRGDPGMTGEKAQELPWVLGKGEDLYLSRNYANAATELEKKVTAIREANRTSADHYPKHTMSMTYENVPGEMTGHRPDIGAASFDVQQEYGRGDWTRQPTAEDVYSRDKIYSALDMRQKPPIEYTGSWQGKHQPGEVARPLVYNQVHTAMGMPPEQMAALTAAERFRGLIGAQQAMAGNLPVTLPNRTGKTSILAERMGMNKVGNPESRLPSPAEMAAVEAAAGKHGYMVTPTDRGALLMPTDVTREGKRPRKSLVGPMPGQALTPQQLLRDFDKRGGAADIEAALPGSKTMPAGQEGFYLPDVMSPASLAGRGVSTGKALSAFAKAPEATGRKILGDPEVRETVMTKLRRDAAAAAQGAQIREDLQKTREFFGDADPEKVAGVLDLIRKGVRPGAAMAAFGFSLKGMAAEPEPQRQ